VAARLYGLVERLTPRMRAEQNRASADPAQKLPDIFSKTAQPVAPDLRDPRSRRWAGRCGSTMKSMSLAAHRMGF
jgi:hypothetical protein